MAVLSQFLLCNFMETPCGPDAALGPSATDSQQVFACLCVRVLVGECAVCVCAKLFVRPCAFGERRQRGDKEGRRGGGADIKRNS